MHWLEESDSGKWDYALAELSGHPLQSALWGDAKKKIDGISDKRLAFYDNDRLTALVRIENRGLNPVAKIAWIPRGPVLAPYCDQVTLQKVLLYEIKKMGYIICAI